MYLGLVFFTAILCHKTSNSLIPSPFFVLRLSPLHHPTSFKMRNLDSQFKTRLYSSEVDFKTVLTRGRFCPYGWGKRRLTFSSQLWQLISNYQVFSTTCFSHNMNFHALWTTFISKIWKTGIPTHWRSVYLHSKTAILSEERDLEQTECYCTS